MLFRGRLLIYVVRAWRRSRRKGRAHRELSLNEVVNPLDNAILNLILECGITRSNLNAWVAISKGHLVTL